MTLRANAVIEPRGDGGPFDCPHRILWCSKKRNEAVLFRLHDPLGIPFYCEYTTVSQWIQSKQLEYSQVILPSWVQVPEDQIPLRDRLLRDKRWNQIQQLVTGANRDVIFDKEMRGHLIRKQAKETGKSRESFYPLLKLYWQYGQAPNALLPAFSKCSRRGEIRGAGDKKRGRPRKVLKTGHDPEAIGVNVTKDDLKIFVSSIRHWHLRKGQPLTQTYDHMIDKYYSRKELRDGEVFAIPVAENRKIQMPTFRRWAKLLLADQTLLHEVMDEVLWGKKYRGRPGKARDTTTGPTDIFEIDATPDNCYLVSAYHPNHLIGRMIIYYVIDRSSTMIVGLHTALEGPSWNTARMAIYNAFSDKVEYCKQYGVDISMEEWPSQEMCSLLVADQGDVFTNAAQASLQKMLHLDSDYNAAGQADRKGTVEGKHVQINEQISWVAGAWRARAAELEKSDWKALLDDACLTLSQRTQIIIHEVLDHNNNEPVPHLLTKEMIKAGVRPYRRDIYLWGLEHQTGEPPTKPDPQQLYRCLLPMHRSSITEAGIVFQQMTYLPEVGDHRMLLARARAKRIPVTIHVDPNSTNTIYQFDSKTGAWTRWLLSSHSWERYANMRLEEVLELYATDQFAAHDAADQEAERSSIKRQKQRKIESNAKKRKRAAPAPPRDSLAKDGVAQHRKQEKELERARLARQAPNPEPQNNAPAAEPTTRDTADTKPTRREIMARRKAKVIAARSDGKV